MFRGRPRLSREFKTVKAMITLYCREQHYSVQGLCIDCKNLSDYALVRLDKCPFQESKTTCLHCKTHCYKDEMRELIRKVMRAAGPKMTVRHPLLTLLHYLDGRRKEPLRRREPQKAA